MVIDNYMPATFLLKNILNAVLSYERSYIQMTLRSSNTQNTKLFYKKVGSHCHQRWVELDQFLPLVIALFHTSLKTCLSKSTPYGKEHDVIVVSWYCDSLHLISCGDLLHRTGGKETS